MGAEAAISTAVQLLGDVLIQKVKFIRGVAGEMELLKDELTRMQAFLEDANKKQAGDERVRNWISEIREVALDTEDTIEMFTLNLDTANSRGLLQGCACFPNHVLHLDRIGEEIQSIRVRLAKIRESRETYGIKDLGESGEPAGRSEVEARRRLAPWLKDEHLVGMEDDVQKLLEPIMNQENKGLYLMAVVGMGGIGKSTLAREVYNRPGVVSGRFDCRGWVTVSSDFTPLETIKQVILEAIGSKQVRKDIKQLEKLTKDRSYLLEKLERLLHEQLDRKTYFIVLDDVWEMDHFVRLKSIFPNQQDKTSRLLFTTRTKDVATQCQMMHEMRFLDPKESWEMFLKKGLVKSNEEFPNELEHIGRKIVMKCDGLPLAITVIGGLLAEIRSSEDEWQNALNQLESHLSKDKSSISAILELSYQNLTPKLQSCFLSLAFFKEDATIPVKRLANIMVGQGLIERGATTEEEIVRGYLDKLINRNMVQVKDRSYNTHVKSCYLHDSLRHICLKKAKEEIGLEVLKGDDRISSNKPRHCFVQGNDQVSFSINKKKHIRSLFFNADYCIEYVRSSYWEGFQHLKNLEFDGNFARMNGLPPSFRLLHGLKQLRIYSDYPTDFYLPTWLSTFKKLEILNLSHYSVKFPKVALQMNSLRHIYAKFIIGLKMNDGWKNIETIKIVSKKDWVRNSLRMKDVKCHIRELAINLDDDDGRSIYDERHIRRTTVIENSEESKRMRELLEKLEKLVKLHLRWFCDSIDAMIIIPPLTNLTKLKLDGEMMKRPSASILPPNLSHLKLSRTCLREDPMQELSKLRNLSYLKLKWGAYMGERMQVSKDCFPSLRGLSLKCLFDLRSLDIEEGGMPKLKLLRVQSCQNLDTENLANKFFELQILS